MLSTSNENYSEHMPEIKEFGLTNIPNSTNETNILIKKTIKKTSFFYYIYIFFVPRSFSATLTNIPFMQFKNKFWYNCETNKKFSDSVFYIFSVGSTNIP